MKGQFCFHQKPQDLLFGGASFSVTLDMYMKIAVIFSSIIDFNKAGQSLLHKEVINIMTFGYLELSKSLTSQDKLNVHVERFFPSQE